MIMIIPQKPFVILLCSINEITFVLDLYSNYSIVHAGAHKGVHGFLIIRFVKGQHQLIELQPSLRGKIDRGISIAQQMPVHNEPSHTVVDVKKVIPSITFEFQAA